MRSVPSQLDKRGDATPAALLHAALNGRWHKQALWAFLLIVVAHWAEHLLQAFQIFVLGWARPAARGGLGLLYPWLVSSEWLHYLYAVIMLLGLYLLRPAFTGRARLWWNIALAIQFWHHFEHALLLGQALAGQNLFGAAAPTSILQLIFARVELHLFYNLFVFVPMVIAMYYHFSMPPDSNLSPQCNCAPRRGMV